MSDLVFDRMLESGDASGSDYMSSILTAGSRLPIENSKSFTFTGDSVRLRIYQGDSRWVFLNERVHSIDLEFESEELEKRVRLTLKVSKDGKLTASANEKGHRNTKDSQARRTIGEQIFQCMVRKKSLRISVVCVFEEFKHSQFKHFFKSTNVLKGIA